MLEEAVRKMKGEERRAAHGTTVINLGISVRIDDSYIPEENQRLRMYKRIAGAADYAALNDVRAELEDRYGKPPESVVNLLAAGEIRLHCEQLGIAQLERKRTAIEETAAATSAAKTGANGRGPAPLQPLRPGQIARPAPPARPLQHSFNAVSQRQVTNATLAARATVGVRPANAPMAQAGKIKAMRDMLHVKFIDRSGEESFANAGASRGQMGVDPGLLMKLVSRNAKNGAQFTPQGVLRWPLSSSKAEDVLAETAGAAGSLDGERPVTN